MVSFYVKILITPVSANKSIHITLSLIYNTNKITKILRKVKIKSLLLLCEANVIKLHRITFGAYISRFFPG